ncbi:transketolase [Streptococcus ictaluri]|uniref:Transketolase, thiamine pyrophosphate-binding domain protein n=1 Tax=Streptococcus ictaluri 707-05 TaxID=764299 RepID=G5K5F6_9STRE|nr:transketolase [Streptococcus ictaluri]EHI68866.1 transketolase, thiamine pyrophosphate-binding domain protein [Streptococcus ictaluri 707-05]
MALTRKALTDLQRFADQIRLNTLETLNHLGFGHYGGLSIVEVLATLYGDIMPMTPELFSQKDRDYFVLSKGHAGPALYSTLYLKGFFDKTFLHSLNSNGTRLPSHPDRNLTPGVDMTTGSLGQGVSVATGIAYAQQIEESEHYTYAIVGDGELNEGQCWEAFQFASHHQLSHFMVSVDDNKKQLDGRTQNICCPGDFVAKFEAFGFESVRVNGSDIEAIHETITNFKVSSSPKPKCIVSDTVKGQGVPDLEKMEANHHLRPTPEEKRMLENAVQVLHEKLEVSQ